MKVLDMINGKTLIITESGYKKIILEAMNKSSFLYDVKFMNIDEYKKNYLFDYNKKTIYYLVNKYKMKVSNAITLIDNLYYIDNKEYSSDKLNYLVSIKRELDDNRLLIYNDYFKNYLSSVSIIVYGYDNLDKFTLNLFNNAEFINNDVLDKKIDIYEFDNIEKEVEFVFNRISDLLIDGVDINSIKLMNVVSEYIPYLKRFSSFYDIPVLLSNSSIYGTMIVSEFLDLVKNNLSKVEILTKLEKYKTSSLYNTLVNLVNSYVLFDDLNSVYDMLLYDIKNTSIPSIKYRNVINLISASDYVNVDDYVFLLGFNNGNIPLLSKDEDYITDNIKEEVGMSDTDDLNRISKLNTILAIKRINHLTISYKLRTPFNTYFPSNLIDDLNYNLQKPNDDNYNYSFIYNKIKYTNMLDEYIKYGECNSKLGLLYYNYGDINYRTYDNAYKGINKISLLEYLNNKLTLSYSSMDNYYKCAFRYYLSNILKIDLYEETFNTIIGNIFHYILSKAFDNDFSFEKEFKTAVLEHEFTSREYFFIDKLKNDLIFIIETIKEYRMNTGLTKELYEQKIDIKIMDNPLVNFKGFVDKIMYHEQNGVTNVSIIDYKTGNPSIKLDDIKYGLSMQLPTYLYLTNKSGLFNNVKYSGFYLQHILDNEIKIDGKHTYKELKRENLKLQGYSTSDIVRLSNFDPTYEDSIMIKGLKTKSDGNLSSTSKVLSDSEIDSIVLLCEDKIKEAINDILNGDFSINPKIIKDKNVGCEYCNFKDICYHKEKDNIYLEEEEV